MARKPLELKRRKGRTLSQCADRIEPILKEWHGAEEGAEIIESLLPEAESVGDAMDRVLAKIVTAESLDLIEIKEHWREIAGPEAAKITSPASFKNKTLFVEVAQGGSIMDLNFGGKSRMLASLRTRYGAGFCRDIRFRNAG